MNDEKQIRIDGGEDRITVKPDGGQYQPMLFAPALELPKVKGPVPDPLGTMTLKGVD